MKGIIDRFEGKYAVIELENGKIKNIETVKVPKEAKEGDVLLLEDTITIDYEETKKRKEKIQKLSEGLWE